MRTAVGKDRRSRTLVHDQPILACLWIMTSSVSSRDSFAPSARGDTKLQLDQNPFVPEYSPLSPIDCESYYALVDNAIGLWRNLGQAGTTLIVISRTGSSDRTPSVGADRLNGITAYLTQKKVVFVTATASGDLKAGQIELYVGGRKVTSIPVRKNSRSACFGLNGG